ncbi:MAG: Mut7-C RNAse domain-containing protein [Actinomycetota bacterium]
MRETVFQDDDSLRGMPSTVTVRFYAELNDFLAAEKRYRACECTTSSGQTVKDLIESRGIPHTEVDLIVVNGESVGFEHRLHDGDRVAVYPVFESVDISSALHLRPSPLRSTRFIADANLGQLARYLRLCGFDTVYRRDIDDEELVAISVGEARVLVTRDVGVLKRSSVTHGYYVRSSDPRTQLLEVVRRFDLAGSVRPFMRCMNCNGELAGVDKTEVLDELEPDTRRFYDEFMRCLQCGRVYWKGSHFDKLQALADEALGAGPPRAPDQ